MAATENTAVLTDFPADGVRCIRLNRPERLNAMNTDLVTGIHRELDAAAADNDCRVVVLTGSGRGFCAGADLMGYGEVPGVGDVGPINYTFAIQKQIATLISHMRSIPQPIIAAVNGPAAGGGLALVLGSDVRLAARSARFNVAFIRAGYSACDIGTSWLLPRIVGVARAQELMLTGRIIDVDEAHRIGLVVAVHDDDKVVEAALDKAREIMLNGPWQVALTKEAMWTALEIPGMQAAIDLENRQQVLVSMTKDARESRQAFLEKRPPRYTNH